MPPFATIPATERNSAAQHQDPSPMSQPFDLPALASSLADKSPQDILKAAFEHFGDELWISFSGAEDVVLVDMAWKLNRNVKVFSLDTGRLHPETYRFIDQVREHYGIAIDVLSPDPRLLEPLVKEKGLFSFYRDGHGECCGIRKIEPLKRKLAGVRAWATGQRRDQSPGTRSQVAVLEIDGAFSTPEKPLYKFNPLSSMTSEEVWAISACSNCPTTACTNAAISASAANPAPVRCCPTSTSARAAGGGGSHPQGVRAARRQPDQQGLKPSIERMQSG